MASPEIKRIYTYADYEKLPEGAPYQLIGGDLVKEPSPVPYHQMVSMRIEFELVKFVVEILSPSSAYYDLRHKMHVYETSGVREYWVVDPIEKGVEIYQNINGEFKLFNKALSSGLIRSAVLEGFTVELEKVLRSPKF